MMQAGLRTDKGTRSSRAQALMFALGMMGPTGAACRHVPPQQRPAAAQWTAEDIQARRTSIEAAQRDEAARTARAEKFRKDRAEQLAAIAAAQLHRRLARAIKECNERDLNMVIADGAVFDPSDVDASIETGCVAAVRAGDTRLTAPAVIGLVRMIPDKIEGADARGLTAERGAAYLEAMKELLTGAKVLCDAGAADVCSAIAAVKTRVLAMRDEQEAADREYKEGRDLVAKACPLQAEIDEAEETIAREKQIAKVSGARNLAVLHEQGAIIVDTRSELDAIRAEFKQRTGKTMDIRKACVRVSE